MRTSSFTVAAFLATAFSSLPILSTGARADSAVSQSDLASVQRRIDELSRQTSESISNLEHKVSNIISESAVEAGKRTWIEPRQEAEREVRLKRDIINTINKQNTRANTAHPDQATINQMVTKALTDNPALLRAALASLKQGGSDAANTASRPSPAAKQ
ncbi:hypothetical protein [Granulibacter bethesdensis]|uniref:hypothetical protein n=1 Tax=Granulibacter bethesdensis TaxID=364410 RepID=UPI00090972D7|nr:hypothetical protein [Granulibacter bethesdensis]APH60076.1 putative secreted protein [Granulibacter bethesdensis]